MKSISIDSSASGRRKSIPVAHDWPKKIHPGSVVVMIDMACREYAEARKILGSVSLRDAARYFVRHNLEDLVQREVPEIVEEMIEARRNAGVGTRGMRDSIRKGMTEPLGKSSNKPGW